MVLIHFKKDEKNQFYFETTSNCGVKALMDSLIDVINGRSRLERLIFNMEGLAEHGPLRPEALRGLTTPETFNSALDFLKPEERMWVDMKPGPHQVISVDKTGYRTGIAPNEKLAQTIRETINQVKSLTRDHLLLQGKSISLGDVKEGLNLLKGAVMMAYPGYHGLPTWDPVYLILEDKADILSMYPDSDWFDKASTVIWWAKKELNLSKELKDYIGTNEKTKLVVKLMAKGKGAPVFEPPIDSETHKKMLAFYYKRQEQQKQLEENKEDDYLNSEWSNPNKLKNFLQTGGNNIQFKHKFN